MADYPVYAKLSDQKLAQLGINNLDEIGDCDPAWDYAAIYPELKEARTKLDYLVDELSGVENATPVIDKALKEAVNQLVTKLESVRAKLS